MKNTIYLSIGLLALFAASACVNEHKKEGGEIAKVVVDSKTFLKDGIDGALTEIKASGLAITNSNNQRVIGLAKMMIEDHTKSDSVLQKMEIDMFPAEKDTIAADHQQILADLAKKTGPAFDKAYIQLMVNDHQGAVQLFTGAGNNSDKTVSGYATETLPVIKMHLDSATAISASLK